jgi:hypothetical protein
MALCTCSQEQSNLTYFVFKKDPPAGTVGKGLETADEGGAVAKGSLILIFLSMKMASTSLL